MKAQRHPLTQLGVEDMPGCLIGIDLCIDIANTSGLMFASQALIRMRDAKSLLQGLIEREEEGLRQREESGEGLAEEVAREIATPPMAEAPRDAAPASKPPAETVPAKAKTVSAPAAAKPEITSDVFTPERLTLFRSQWPNRALKSEQVLANVNALPGRPCASVAALYTKAKQLGLSRLASTKDADSADKADFSTEDMNEAREMLGRGVDGRGLHEWFGGELAFWSDFATAYREQKDAA